MIIKEQTILISGGAGSIGEFLVSEFHSSAKKIIVIDKDEKRLKALNEKFPGISVYAADLTHADDISKIVSEIFQSNNVSVLINNAGLIHSESLINILKPDNKKHSFETWDKTIRSNLYSAFILTVNVTEKMVEKKIKGVIINFSSISANGNLGQTAYSAAKAGVEAMTVTWAKELGIFGIRSAAIAPGFIDTVSTRNALSETNLNKWKKSVPINRLGELKEIYSAAKFIIENDYYNGQVLKIDGGLRI